MQETSSSSNIIISSERRHTASQATNRRAHLSSAPDKVSCNGNGGKQPGSDRGWSWDEGCQPVQLPHRSA